MNQLVTHDIDRATVTAASNVRLGIQGRIS